ncbi:MAG: cation:proton antiporter [Nitrospira sp.]|nr:cation:proton antiporter [Nitrospira sp.]
MGWSWIQSVVIGSVVSVASTMVLARLLLDSGDLRAKHGRVMIGITLVEDLAVVVLTVLLPALGALEPGRFATIERPCGSRSSFWFPSPISRRKPFLRC